MKHNDQMKENKTQVRDVILRTVKTQKLLSAGIVITVVGAIIAALIPPLILAEIVDTITEGNGAPLFLIFWNDRNYRYDGICKRGITYCVRAEDYACAQKQYDEKIYKSYSG